MDDVIERMTNDCAERTAETDKNPDCHKNRPLLTEIRPWALLRLVVGVIGRSVNGG